MEYLTELLWLGAKVQPPKTNADIKEQFRTGLDASLVGRMDERPEWDNLELAEYVKRADRLQRSGMQARRHVTRSGTPEPSTSRFYSIRGSGRGRSPSPMRRKPEKGTPMWDDWCKQNRACFECGGEGHTARDCKERRTRQPQQPDKRRRMPTPARGRSTSRDRSKDRGRSRSRSASRDKSVSFQEEN